MNSTKRLYKTEAQIREIVESEVEKMITPIYEKACQDTTYQTLATVFVVLNREYHFGKKRLHELKDQIESEFVAMETGILGKPYDAMDCVKVCKEQWDIDFEESLYAEWDKSEGKSDDKQR